MGVPPVVVITPPPAAPATPRRGVGGGGEILGESGITLITTHTCCLQLQLQATSLLHTWNCNTSSAEEICLSSV